MKKREMAMQEGAGERGVVFFAVDILSRPVAVKLWMLSSDYSEDAYKEGSKEATKLASLRHPNILEVLYAGMDSNKRFYSVMRRLEGPTLGEYLQNARPLEDRYILWYDIARAMNYAYTKDTYHGDLHEGKIAVEGGRAKVFDFGTSVTMVNRSLLQQNDCGRLKKLARELFPEWDEGILLPINPMTQSPYSADLVLCQLVAWTTWEGEYLLLKRRRRDDDYGIKHTLASISITMGEAPVFDLGIASNRIVSFLQPLSSSDKNETYLKWFFANLYAHCQGMLSGCSFGQPVPTGEDIGPLTVMTTAVYREWQDRFASLQENSFTHVVNEFVSTKDVPVGLP